MESIGERIKKARLERGFSQTELAVAANVSQPTVANWETGSHAPRQPALVRLADILDTSPHWFLSGDLKENGHTLAPKKYLNTPIHHVPIIQWPGYQDLNDQKIQPGAAQDYIAISIEVRKPFALLANDPAMAARFPIGSAIIFDGVAGPLEDNACYLFQTAGSIVLRSWQSGPDRLEALPDQSVADTHFVNERPVPLARALMSLRRH